MRHCSYGLNCNQFRHPEVKPKDLVKLLQGLVLNQESSTNFVEILRVAQEDVPALSMTVVRGLSTKGKQNQLPSLDKLYYRDLRIRTDL